MSGGAAPGDAGSLLGALTGLRNAVQLLIEDLPILVSQRITLLALELRRSRQALALIVGLLTGAAVMLFTGWLALWFGLISIAVDLGLKLGWAVLIAVLFNGLAGALMIWRALALVPLLALPATTRHLTRAGRRRAAAEATATPAGEGMP